MARESKGSGDIRFSNKFEFFDWLFENKEILNGSQNVRADCAGAKTAGRFGRNFQVYNSTLVPVLTKQLLCWLMAASSWNFKSARVFKRIRNCVW